MIFTDWSFNTDPKLLFGCGITELKKGALKIRGIYAIVCLANEKIYFGSSKDIRNRIIGHLWHLSKSTHCNGRLLNAYNKYGKENFAYYLMEEVPDNLSLLDVEQNYLDNYQGNLFNINKTTTGRPFTDLEKEEMAKKRRGENNPYRLKNKDGEIFEFFSTGNFAKEHNLTDSGVLAVLVGDLDSYRDFYLPETPIKEFKLMNSKGEIYSFKYAAVFARENNLDRSCVRDVLNGELQSVGGWTLPGNPKIKKEYQLVNPEGIIHTFDNIRQFARENGLNPTCVSSIILGRIRSNKGWTAVGRPRPKIEHKVFDPMGNLHIFRDIKAFAKANNLEKQRLSRLIKGLIVNYKGWTPAK